VTFIANLFGWIARHALLFILIIAALVGYTQYQKSSRNAAGLEASVATLDGAQAELEALIAAQQNTAVTGLEAGQRRSIEAVEQRLAEARRALAGLPEPGLDPITLLTAPQNAIVSDFRNRIDAERLRQEITFLESLKANLKSQGAALSLDTQIREKQADLQALGRAYLEEAENLRAIKARPAMEHYALDGLKLVDLKAQSQQKLASNKVERAAIKSDLERLFQLREAIGTVQDLAVPSVATEMLRSQLAPLSSATTAQSDRLATTAEREARRWYQRLGIADLLKPAFITLLAIILAPLAIRSLFYWVLAPIATRQGAIRLLETTGPVPPPAERSSVSKSIRLSTDTELLVKQGYQQTSSGGGEKATQLLLDSSFPLSSLASGLWFLMRIRGGPSDSVTISATQDPFAEVALLELPAGASMVLQPRALAGVLQPREKPLRITSHWRLGTLNAWLTWQLRFLVFHGPATLILKGGRGVRFEPAEAGRIIGQDQLIGFSPGLAYTATRTETFLPYLFGQESLLKDKVAAGEGLLIAEEAPMAGRRGGPIKKGLEGAFDAALKAFGI